MITAFSYYTHQCDRTDQMKQIEEKQCNQPAPPTYKYKENK